MKLKSFGCSFIYGAELPDVYYPNGPSNLTWPALLAKDLGYEYECCARAGTGNLHLLDTLLPHINNADKDTVFVIGWTWAERFDYKSGKVWQTLLPTSKSELQEQTKAYYKYLYNDYTSQLNFLSYINVALAALHKKNLRYIMTYMDNTDIFSCSSPALTTLRSEVIPHLTTWNGEGFNYWCALNKLERMPGRHWGVSAQTAAFNYIKDSGVINKIF